MNENKDKFLTFKSKEKFLVEYNKIRSKKEDISEFYLNIWTGIAVAVSEGDISRLKKLDSVIENCIYIEDGVMLRGCYNIPENKIKDTNIIILSSKYNKLNVLEYFFSNDNRLLNNISVITQTEVLPTDLDDSGHNAFYYAIVSNNVELIRTLIDKWPGDYFKTRDGNLNKILSSSYAELQLKNAYVSDEMELFLLEKLVSFNFFTDALEKNEHIHTEIENVRARIEFLVETIDMLVEENYRAVDCKFLLLIKYIASSIHILKRKLRSTYDVLPWEEIEFCLINFAIAHSKEKEMNFFCKMNLNIVKVQQHLKTFGKVLREETDEIMKQFEFGISSSYPNLKREEIVEKIISSRPEFEDLYNIYRQLRDVSSMEKISRYLNLALSVDPKEKDGVLIITRALQVMGECLKNTLETPKLSHATCELIFLSLSENTRNVITDLRNSLSHAHSMFERSKIEKNADPNFFIGVKSDLKKISEVITDILYNYKSKTVKTLLQNISDCKSLEEMKEIAEVFNGVPLDEKLTEHFEDSNHNFLTKLDEKLKSAYEIIKKSIYEEHLFEEIFSIIKSHKEKSNAVEAENSPEFHVLWFMMRNVFKDFDNYAFKMMKFFTSKTLSDVHKEMKSTHLDQIAEKTLHICYVIKAKTPSDNYELRKIIFEILHLVDFKWKDMKCVQKLREHLKLKGSQAKKTRSENLSTNDRSNYLSSKLNALKDLLNKNALNVNLAANLPLYLSNEKLQSLTEMLVLDILSIYSDKCLENNLHYLDENIPVLTGKALRNHLAHYNDIVEYTAMPSKAIILNARKLTEDSRVINMNKIGRLIIDNPFQLKQKRDQDLMILDVQETMFKALEDGNSEIYRFCLKKGADIRGRNHNLSTVLHFAVKGSSMEIVKSLINKNIDVHAVDFKGCNVLHIAAASGRGNIIQYLIENSNLHVDSSDNYGKTALHIAAENGYLHIVQILLKNKTNFSAKDKANLSPIFYATRNNHIDVTDILLRMYQNVDTVECYGGFTLLHEAAEHGHIDLIEFLHLKGANINAANDEGFTILHAAALNGHTNIVDALSLKGANINAETINGCTALYFAAQNGHGKVVDMLLKHGANTNVADKTNNYAPLHYAAKDGHEKIVQSLLGNGAQTHIYTSDGMTPLHFSALNGHLGILKHLLACDSKIDANNSYSCTPLHLATENNQIKIVEYLIKHNANVDARDINGVTPLHIAAYKGCVNICYLLIKGNADIHIKDQNGLTSLHKAAFNGDTEILDLLLKYKADVNLKNKDGYTPLYLAASNGNTDAVVFLIENKAEYSIKKLSDALPLFTAIIKAHVDIVQLLIQQTFDQATIISALNFAVEHGNRETLKVLLENGAITETNKRINSLLQRAVKLGHKQIVKCLLEYGIEDDAEIHQALQISILQGFQDIVMILLDSNLDVNYKSIQDLTLLHIAAGKGHVDIIKVLVAKGANVHAQTRKNMTPLYAASEAGHDDVVEFLISKGVKTNSKTNEGFTPLHAAASHGHNNVVKVLLENKADVAIKDNKNRTAIELAVSQGHLQVVKTLLHHNKPDVNYKGNDDWTALHIASQGSNLQIIKYLVKIGYDIQARNSSGSKPIHIAAREGNLDTVKFFIKYGLSINEIGAYSQTLLHYSAMKGQLKIMEFLLEEGADVCAKDVNALTPLHIAARLGHKDAVQLLLEHGATYDSVSMLNKKPSDMAANIDIISTFELIKKMFKAVKQDALSDVENFIKKGAIVNANSAKIGTPLHYASWKGYDAAVSILLQNGGNPNSTEKNGHTPLHYAVKFSFLNIVKILLSSGAVYNIISDNGKTPLDYAADKNIANLFKLLDASFKHVKRNDSKVIQLLNEIKDISIIKAIMRAQNSEKETLVVFAIKSNFTQIQQLKNIAQGDMFNQVLQLFTKSNYKKALYILETLLEKRKAIFGTDNPATFDIQMEIIKLLYMQGHYLKVLDMLRQLLDKQIAILSLTNRDILITRKTIALVLHRLGQNEESLKIYEEVYEIQKQTLEENHSDIMDTQFEMALTLHALERYEEALAMNQTVYQYKTKVSGPCDPIAIRAQNNMAMVMSSKGNYDEALKNYKQVLEKKKIFFGSNHCDTLRTQQSIAGVLGRQHKDHEALEAYHEVLKIQKVALGPNHPETLNTDLNIADVFFRQGKCIKALEAYERVLTQRKIVFGENHPANQKILMKIEVIKLTLEKKGIFKAETLHHTQNDIIVAANVGNTETVQFLLKNGTSANVKDIDGRTPLHFAASGGHLNVVKMLLENGADITAITNKGNTPLHTAVHMKHLAIVDIMMGSMNCCKKTNFLNVQTLGGGMTALHIAAKNGSPEITRTLLAHGAIYNYKNTDENTPLNLSKHGDVSKILKLLDDLFEGARTGSLEIINKLQNTSPDDFAAVTNARNNIENTLLQVAIINKHKKIAVKLSELLRKSK